MKDGLRKYLSGQQNAIRDEFIISREKAGWCEHVYVSHPELIEPLYQFWTGAKKKASGTPKHTGGKQSYVMLMIQELAGLIAADLPAENVGYLMCLVPFVEWRTGRLVLERENRQMTLIDIQQKFKRSRRKTLYILSSLKKHGLLVRDTKGYALSRSLIKKGGARQ